MCVPNTQGTQAWQALFILSHHRVHFVAHFILHSHRMQHLLSRSYFYHWWTFFCFYFILYFSSSSSFRLCIVFLFCPLFFIHTTFLSYQTKKTTIDHHHRHHFFVIVVVVKCICNHRIDSPSSQIKQRFIANACRNNTICFGLNLMPPYVYVCAPFFCVFSVVIVVENASCFICYCKTNRWFDSHGMLSILHFLVPSEMVMQRYKSELQ